MEILIIDVHNSFQTAISKLRFDSDITLHTHSDFHSITAQDFDASDTVIFILADSLKEDETEKLLKFTNSHPELHSCYIGIQAAKNGQFEKILNNNNCTGIVQLPLIPVQVQKIVEDEKKSRIAHEMRIKQDKILRSIHTMTNSIAQRPELNTFLQLIVDNAAYTLDADRVVLITIDTQGEVIREIYEGGPFAHKYQMPENNGYYTEIMHGLTGWAIQHRETAFSPKLLDDPREPDDVRKRRVEHKVGSIIISPIFTNENVYGTLTAIKHVSKRDFFTDEIELMKSYASFAMLNLENFLLLDRVIEREKESTMISMVNSFAHKINTPLGNSITSLSYIIEKAKQVQSEVQANTIRKSQLVSFMDNFNEVSESVDKNLAIAKKLIKDIKHLTSLTDDYKKTRFKVKELVRQAAQAVSFNIDYGCVIEINAPEELEICSYNRALFEIISSLMVNSIVHGFTDSTNNTITIDIEKKSHKLYITYCDNGSGIPEENANKVFSPFYNKAPSGFWHWPDKIKGSCQKGS